MHGAGTHIAFTACGLPCSGLLSLTRPPHTHAHRHTQLLWAVSPRDVQEVGGVGGVGGVVACQWMQCLMTLPCQGGLESSGSYPMLNSTEL